MGRESLTLPSCEILSVCSSSLGMASAMKNISRRDVGYQVSGMAVLRGRSGYEGTAIMSVLDRVRSDSGRTKPLAVHVRIYK